MDKIQDYSMLAYEEIEEVARREINRFLLNVGITDETLRAHWLRRNTFLYMAYWYHRLRNNKEEQDWMVRHLEQYLGVAVDDPVAVARELYEGEVIGNISQYFVEKVLVPKPSVDLVITRTAEDGELEVLCIDRAWYPLGVALPGGFIRDSDETNPLHVEPQVFAALRVAGEKVIGKSGGLMYRAETDVRGATSYLVETEDGSSWVRLNAADEGGYRFREHVASRINPADARGLVDTVGFLCTAGGALAETVFWKK